MKVRRDKRHEECRTKRCTTMERKKGHKERKWGRGKR